MGQRNTMLIVDDEKLNRVILNTLFSSEHEILEAASGEQALLLAEQHLNQLTAVLLDVVMPTMDGLEVLRTFKEKGWMEHFPVFLVTAESTREVVIQGYSLGVTDVIAKPFAPELVKGRVDNAIELFRYRRGKGEAMGQTASSTLSGGQTSASQAILQALEIRNARYSGKTENITNIVKQILMNFMLVHQECGLTDGEIDAASRAAAYHDVGKLALPKKIIRKNKKLSPPEYARMKEHTILGPDLLSQLCPEFDDTFLKYVEDICRCHHERYDGKGYPKGLSGDQIPIWAQAAGLADSYEALVSARPYRKAYSHDQALEMILSGECGAFQPSLLESFQQVLPQIRATVYGMK